MKVESIVFHGANIPCVQDEAGAVFFAVKPICDAIGVDSRAQRTLIKADEVLGPEVKRFSPQVGGQVREMLFLPLEHLTGWLFQINTKLVKPESREILVAFKRECYKVLHAHFFGHIHAAPSGKMGVAEMHVHNCMILQTELILLQEKRRAIDKAITAKTREIAKYNYRATPYQQQKSLFASRLQEEANIANF